MPRRGVRVVFDVKRLHGRQESTRLSRTSISHALDVDLQDVDPVDAVLARPSGPAARNWTISLASRFTNLGITDAIPVSPSRSRAVPPRIDRMQADRVHRALGSPRDVALEVARATRGGLERVDLARRGSAERSARSWRRSSHRRRRRRHVVDERQVRIRLAARGSTPRPSATPRWSAHSNSMGAPPRRDRELHGGDRSQEGAHDFATRARRGSRYAPVPATPRACLIPSAVDHGAAGGGAARLGHRVLRVTDRSRRPRRRDCRRPCARPNAKPTISASSVSTGHSTRPRRYGLSRADVRIPARRSRHPVRASGRSVHAEADRVEGAARHGRGSPDAGDVDHDAGAVEPIRS